ncbi:hypothetical protein [Streptomyces griseoflavus]|nr:hypothetical protein [Streptomyces griseoflavus]
MADIADVVGAIGTALAGMAAVAAVLINWRTSKRESHDPPE